MKIRYPLKDYWYLGWRHGQPASKHTVTHSKHAVESQFTKEMLAMTAQVAIYTLLKFVE